MNEQTFWPCTLAELNLGEPDPAKKIQPEDIATYAYPPNRPERYTASGLLKAKTMGLFPLNLEDFGAIAD